MLADYGGRVYTTRAKEEQRRTAAATFVGSVRHWEKRWVRRGHLRVLSWERTDQEINAAPRSGPESAELADIADMNSINVDNPALSDEE